MTSIGLNIVQLDPSSFTAKCTAALNAGEFVKPDNATIDVVSSTGMKSLADGDITIDACDATADGLLVVGIAAETGAANDYIAVYTEGIFILEASEAIAVGNRIQKSINNASEDNYAGVLDVAAASDIPRKIGIALTTANAAGSWFVAMVRM